MTATVSIACAALGSPFPPRDRSWKGDSYYLHYFGLAQPAIYEFNLPEAHEYQLDIIDTWNMTIQPVEGLYRGKFWLDLPGKPYHALQARRVDA